MLQENKHYTPCVRTTTISNLISKNNCTSLKFDLPQPRFFHHARKNEPVQSSNCLKHKFSITKQVKQCTPCVPNKTIRNPIDQPRIFHYEVKQTVHSMCAKEHLNKLCIPNASSKNFPSIIAQKYI